MSVYKNSFTVYSVITVSRIASQRDAAPIAIGVVEKVVKPKSAIPKQVWDSC